MKRTVAIRCVDHQKLSAESVRDFYCRHATWKVPARVEAWATMLRHSAAIVGAWQGENLIGMARALSDRVRYATIVDVLVHPDERRQGIGRRMIAELLKHPSLRVRGIYLGTPNKPEFYESCGFVCANDKGFWMLKVQDTYAVDFILPVSEP